MRANLVLTLTGPDRVGIVEDVTRLLLDLDGNVETSRMARLGGEFAILMLLSLPAERLDGLETSLGTLAGRGYKITTSRTESSYAESHSRWRPYRIELRGADHEGIVHEVARTLSRRGINIESMDAGTSLAPITGTPLFSMTALVAVPPDLPGQSWEAELQEVEHRLNVEIRVTPAQET
jgi:glycine cleavage system transcriptional repressor